MEATIEATTTDAMTTEISVPLTQTPGQSVSCSVHIIYYYDTVVVFTLLSAEQLR